MQIRRRIPLAPAISVFVSSLFLRDVAAQNNNLPPLTQSSSASPATSNSGSSVTQSATSNSGSSATQSASPNPGSSTSGSQSTQNAKSSSATGSSSSSGSASSGTSTLPAITTSTSSGLGSLITDLPKLPGADYPPPAVPPTADAPFMQKSNLPEGTVFICVGAALGFIALVVLAWRGLVAWSLHRSVRQAALAQSSKYRDETKKGGYKNPPAQFYSAGPVSALSLDHLTSSKGGSKTNTPARGSLFFSPTAGAGIQTPGNRGSGYLPAGYYAAGNAAAGGGAGMTHLGGGNSISLGNLRPKSHRYSRAQSVGPSPPISPGLPPSRSGEAAYARPSTAGISAQASTSTLNLSVPPQGRAPSAFLEDLFENHPPGDLHGEIGAERR